MENAKVSRVNLHLHPHHFQNASDESELSSFAPKHYTYYMLNKGVWAPADVW